MRQADTVQVLTLACRDRVGVVAVVAGVPARTDGFILDGNKTVMFR